MNTQNQISSAEDMSAAVINSTVAEMERGGPVSHTAIAHDVEQNARELGLENNTGIVSYVGGLRNSAHHFVVTTLDEGVGGLYDGNQIQIAVSTIKVGTHTNDTVSRMREVIQHEEYHLKYDHTEPMTTFDAGQNVIISGERFTMTETVEGLTVNKTGKKHVSAEYVDHERRLLAAATKAALTISDVANAVNISKDLTAIDDRNRSPEGEMAMAA